MLTACIRCGEPQQALDIAHLHLDKPEGLKLTPNYCTYKAMLVASSKLADGSRAMQIFHRVRQSPEARKLEEQGFRALLLALCKDQSGYGDVNAALDEVSAAMAQSKVLDDGDVDKMQNLIFQNRH